MISGKNFGCGSSREHAVWALLEFGIRAIIAPSFANIFSNNSANNGLLLIRLDERIVENLLGLAIGGDLQLSINLEQQTLSTVGGSAYQFDFDPFRKYCLLNGIDDLDYLLGAKQTINQFKEKREQSLFINLK